MTVSPFRANKTQRLFNVQNEDCVILEELSASVEISETQVALEYVDYSSGTPFLNQDCNIALEQQTDDQASFEEGISGSLMPYEPGVDSFNLHTGTSKLLLFNQMRRAFYNDYHNPTEIFGMENIDFPLSKTNRYLANNFIMFTIPRIVMGDKIQPGSVQFQDTTFDDNILIQDDFNGNLIAGDNLFSKVQEVRGLGNSIYQGTSSYIC